ncbi:MAG: RsmE family RNA methyltransferase [Actinomycetota bacterium]
MGERWFVAPPDSWREGEVLLPPEEAHHARHVLRVGELDVITVTDGQGRVARCAVGAAEGDGLRAEILESERHRRLHPQVVVYQGAAKGSKIEDVVEKLAELGVAETWVYESARSIVRWDEGKRARLNERWASVARAAAKQSRNSFVMTTGGGLGFDDLVERVRTEPQAVVLWEEASLPLRTALHDMSDRVALVVGPEGGLERGEAEALADAGGQLVSLGPRILRTENAAVVCAAALFFHYGLIG